MKTGFLIHLKSFHFEKFLAVSACLLALSAAAFSQTIGLDRQRGIDMLGQIKSDVKKNYYDPQFHQLDIDARFKIAQEKIKEANSNGQIFAIIAQALLDLNDSHTFFLPPGRASKTEYGWEMAMVGEKCFVTSVKPKSDAEAKGLKPGDEVYSIDGFQPTRENLWKIKYSYYSLRPRAGMHLVVISPEGKQRELDVMAKVTQLKRVMNLSGNDAGQDIHDLDRQAEREARFHRHRTVQLGDVFIWKMPEFDMSDEKVDDMMGKVRKQKALIIDLRGNGGGLVDMLKRLSSYFFEEEVKIGDLKSRKEMKPLVVKPRGDGFKGKLVVLIDSRSGSASELFARLIQLGKRGTVIGDRSAGAVMMSLMYGHESGMDTIIPYGTSITAADIIMTDGKSLENVGVSPDETLLVSPMDMAANRDPVLARAAALVGLELTAEKAGTLFPIEWRD